MFRQDRAGIHVNLPGKPSPHPKIRTPLWRRPVSAGLISRRRVYLAALGALVWLVVGAMVFPGQAARLPLLGGGSAHAAAPAADSFVLVLPGIDLQVPVVETTIAGDTWDFTNLGRDAAHLALTGYPGQGTNTVIGAHYELRNFVPGPFFHLDQLAVGDPVQVVFQGTVYTYEVIQTLVVDPTAVAVAYRTADEMLTLLTCYDYDASGGGYHSRFVVRATLVDGP